MQLDNLKILGLTENEIEIYLTILKNGKSTGTEIRKLSKIVNSRVYAALDSLIEKGLVVYEKSQKGKKGQSHSEEWKVNHSKMISGENHPMYNKKHNDGSKKKMSIAKKGKYTGSKNPNGKKIINTITGEIHDSLQEVANILGVSKPHLCRKINPNNKTHNNTPYKYM